MGDAHLDAGKGKKEREADSEVEAGGAAPAATRHKLQEKKEEEDRSFRWSPSETIEKRRREELMLSFSPLISMQSAVLVTIVMPLLSMSTEQTPVCFSFT